jgi:hypothetical protein
MKKHWLHVGPSLLLPATFAYVFYEGTQAQGWSGFGYGAFLALIATVSAAVSAVAIVVALALRQRGNRDWRWWLTSAAVAGSPAIVFFVLQAIR